MNENNPSTSGIVSNQFVKTTDAFTVYTELDSRGFNRLVKAKRLGKWHMLKGLKQEYVNSALYIELLNKEFDITFSLDHPNIIRVIDKEQDKNIGACIVMEYVDGITLTEFLKTNPTQPIKQKIVLELLDAMTYFHSKQVIHRDLKPDNILVTHNGNNVKIIDFGLSDTDYHDILKQPVGTRKYAAPEQLKNNTQIDARADIYAFGKILEEINLPRCKPIIKKCTQTDCKNRFDNVGEILKAFQKRKNFTWVYLSVSLVLIGLVLGSLLLLKHTDKVQVAPTPKNSIKEAISPLSRKQGSIYKKGEISSNTEQAKTVNAAWEENLIKKAKLKIDGYINTYVAKAKKANTKIEAHNAISNYNNEITTIIEGFKGEVPEGSNNYAQFKTACWDYTVTRMKEFQKIADAKPTILNETEQNSLGQEPWEIKLSKKAKQSADSLYKVAVAKEENSYYFKPRMLKIMVDLSKEIPSNRRQSTIGRWEKESMEYSEKLSNKLDELLKQRVYDMMHKKQ